MSAGHGHTSGDIDTAPLSTVALERLLHNPEVTSRLFSLHQLNYDYDMPFLAGYSKDGTTIYLDRHLPGVLKYTHEGATYAFNPTPLICRHEEMEKAVMDGCGWSYDHAHAAANAWERRGVLEAGLLWGPYNNSLKPCIKADETEKIKQLPPDLDWTPYYTPPVDKALLAHMLEVAGKEQGKVSKTSVDYSPGMAKSHCGPVEKWPRGQCEYFLNQNSCARVKGYIDPAYWCKLFERAANGET